jgi:hypothetical protein
MACVWDVSGTGACLIFAADVHVPVTFTIDFGDRPVTAQVMWRKEICWREIHGRKSASGSHQACSLAGEATIK